MILIDQSYFILDNFVAQRGQPEVVETLQLYIKRYEPVFFAELLGQELYDAFIAGLGAPLPDQKWIDLRDGVSYTDNRGRLIKFEGLANSTSKYSPAANYIYYWYQRGKNTHTTGSGEIIPLLENGHRVSAGDKMVLSWEFMIKQNYACVHYLQTHKEQYPEWKGYGWGNGDWGYFFGLWPNVWITHNNYFFWPHHCRRPEIFQPINTFGI